MTITNPSIPTSSGQDQSQVDERLRQAILDKKEAQIEAWTMQIEQLREHLKDVAANVRQETEQRLSDLVAARDRALTRLEQLKQSTQQSWAEVLSHTDAAFQELADRFHSFAEGKS